MPAPLAPRLWLVAGLALLSLAGCTRPEDPPSVKIDYRVTGTACLVSLAYHDPQRAETHTTNLHLPWHHSFALSPAQVRGYHLHLSASNLCSVGSITATVRENGHVLSQDTVYGREGTATADAYL